LEPTSLPDAPDAVPASTVRSVHTANFPGLLDELGVSLLVTTYQAGRLVVVRSDQGRLNTHFRTFNLPMGLALSGDRLAIGTRWEVREFRDVPSALGQLDPTGRHDACFLPRSSHTTGNIYIHEMAWAGDELWFVNTRFSCLSTLDQAHSFVPRWRPRFISRLEPEDRCHLNGMGMRDGMPRYVTALGDTDSNAGWRQVKARGGVLLDVPSGETILSGLSMPHSPRWHRDQLWACESGSGTLGVVDERAGRIEPVATLPGFTRGLDFAGKYAFVGLSQVRQSAVFSGIAITERPDERACGVWVVDLTTGRIAAFLKFEEIIQEIFAVVVLPGKRYPELINDDEKLLCDSFVLPGEARA
jgi:uncharacterized protein (TIGR03032 family)